MIRHGSVSEHRVDFCMFSHCSATGEGEQRWESPGISVKAEESA